MENRKPFIIYKSSAGSGKTYTLTLEYLKLALAYPGAFKQILAVTFTNKATQEMKARILEYLQRLSEEVRAGEFLDEQLMQHLKVDEEELQKRAKDSLLDILHAYGDFAVSTIDSFFQKVVRAFAREMDLQAKFDVELDQNAVLDRLTDRVIEKVSEDTELKNWLVEYAKEQIQNGNSWDVRIGIRGLGSEIFQEKFKAHREAFQSALDQEDLIKNLKSYIYQEKNKLIELALSMREKANSIRESHGLAWTEFSGGGGTANFVVKLDRLGDKDRPFPEFTDKQLPKISGTEEWHTKTSRKKSEIVAAADGGLRDLILESIVYKRRWDTLQALLKNLNVYGIFRNLILELRELKDEEGILLISDVNDFLREITKDNEAPFIFEKIGNQYKHFLIDEFQDTSDFQWSSFKPLLVNSLASGHTNLLVGDVKQSIYRWRGGKLELLLKEVEDQIGEKYIDIKNLDVNYRSLPNIIDFNNGFFSVLPGYLQDLMMENHQVEAEDLLESAFEGVGQKVPEKKRSLPFQGFAQIEFEGKENRTSQYLEEEEEEDEGVLEYIPELVEKLQDKGYALRDMAFLVRKNSEGALIADRLMDHARANQGNGYSYDVISEESLFLEKSAAVKALISLLKYLRNQEDKVALKTTYYYYSLLKSLPYTHDLFELYSLPDELKEKHRLLEQEVALWLKEPLLELVEALVRFMELSDLDSDLAYISGFKEAVFDFVKNNRADLAGFLDWWELNKNKLTVKIPEDHNAMRILTIHKSKGLQFKAVLMPFLNWSILPPGNQAPVIWSPWEESDFRTVMPLTHTAGLVNTAFSELYSNEVRLAFLDTLNMLYVAFTRAEDFLWAHAEYKYNKDGVTNTKFTGGALFEVFSGDMTSSAFGDRGRWDEESSIFEYGSWPLAVKREQGMSKPPSKLRWLFSDWKTKLQTRNYAWDFGEEGLEDRSKRRLGVLVHEILEQSNSLSDALQVLRQFEFEGRFDQETAREVEEQLKSLFHLPEIQNWYSGVFSSFAEQGILLPGGEMKRPDRILMGENESIVLDFKTGRKKDEHIIQVREYIRLVGLITQKPVKGFVCYLEPTEIVEVYG